MKKVRWILIALGACLAGCASTTLTAPDGTQFQTNSGILNKSSSVSVRHQWRTPDGILHEENIQTAVEGDTNSQLAAIQAAFNAGLAAARLAGGAAVP